MKYLLSNNIKVIFKSSSITQWPQEVSAVCKMTSSSDEEMYAYETVGNDAFSQIEGIQGSELSSAMNSAWRFCQSQLDAYNRPM